MRHWALPSVGMVGIEDCNLAPVPEGATDYERNEVEREWAAAVNASAGLAELFAQANVGLLLLTLDTASSLRRDHAPNQRITEYHDARARLSATVSQILHRLAIERGRA